VDLLGLTINLLVSSLGWEDLAYRQLWMFLYRHLHINDPKLTAPFRITNSKLSSPYQRRGRENLATAGEELHIQKAYWIANLFLTSHKPFWIPLSLPWWAGAWEARAHQLITSFKWCSHLAIWIYHRKIRISTLVIREKFSFKTAGSTKRDTVYLTWAFTFTTSATDHSTRGPSVGSILAIQAAPLKLSLLFEVKH
jgi:hypothetical protein